MKERSFERRSHCPILRQQRRRKGADRTPNSPYSDSVFTLQFNFLDGSVAQSLYVIDSHLAQPGQWLRFNATQSAYILQEHPYGVDLTPLGRRGRVSLGLRVPPHRRDGPAGYQTGAVLAKVLAAASVAAAVPSRSGYLTDAVVQNHVEHGYLNTADRSALLSGDNYLYFP